jgi:hypothetical protein
MLPDTGIDDVKKQRNAEYAKHINDPVLSSLKMEGVRLLFICNVRTACTFISRMILRETIISKFEAVKLGRNLQEVTIF